MNQTRTFLLIAWLFVAFLIWEAWTRDTAAPRREAPAPTEPVPGEVDSGVPAADGIPAMVAAEPPRPEGELPGASAPQGVVTLTTDVLRLRFDARGGTLLSAELLAYGQTADPAAPPVQLMSPEPGRYFVAQFGLTSNSEIKPSHEAPFRTADGGRDYALAAGAERIELPFVWTHDSGLSVRRVFTLERGSYVLGVREEVSNAGETAWSGAAYCQLQRVPPQVRSGFTNPEAYSFAGAAWYSPQDKFNKVKFDKFAAEAPLNRQTSGGWVAMLQHHFFAACIPPAEATATFSLAIAGPPGAPVYRITSVGPGLSVAPGGSGRIEQRLWIGPKLQSVLPTVAPGLDRTSDYGIFTLLAEPLFWVLDKLHRLFGNWGWAIIGLVVLIKLAFYKLSETQYKSFAKMRAVQPRIEALKERYGDDRQKFQMAMMELYKKEKINPMGGCLPILVQIPVFIALYWVLLESVEIRHAPWIGWIHSLTDRDPYFILPALNMATMWLTQKMSPTPGMDPVQKKIMQIMPLAFGVLFAFFPAGLVLYWTTNGVLGLAQQWIITKRHGTPAKA